MPIATQRRNKESTLNLNGMELKKLSKAKLIQIVFEQREALCLQRNALDEKAQRIIELTEQLARLNQERDEQKRQAINKTVNEPSSKKPEWDKEGNPKPKTKKPKKKKRKKSVGCGNQSKSSLIPEETYYTSLTACLDCETDLSDKPGRIVEDTQAPAEKTCVTEEIEETKGCPTCKKIVSSKTEKALPGSDIGLNATIEMAYLWVMCALSRPNIHAFFNHFKTLSMSTAGISKMRNDVKQGTAIWQMKRVGELMGNGGGYGSSPTNEAPITGRINHGRSSR